MDLLDYAILALVVLGAIYGVSRGALRMATSAGSLVIAIYVAYVYHGVAGGAAARALGPSVPAAVGATIGYVIVFVAVFAGIELAGQFVVNLLHTVHMSWVDRLGGAIMGAGVASVVAGLAVVLLTAALPVDAPLLRDSRLASLVLAYNQRLLACVPGEIRDAYQERRDRLVRYWREHEPGYEFVASPTASPEGWWR